MSTSARLDVTELVVVPGVPAQCQLVVANRGSVVEAYTLKPVGDLAAYAVIEPATLSLYPDAEGTATVTITLPEEAVVQAGDVPFGVLVEPREHPADTAVPEAVAHVQPVRNLSAELTPRTSHGSRVGRHTLAIDNRGNQPVTVQLAGKDPDAVVEFRFSPGTVEVAPGTAAFAKIKAKPLERIWRGPSKTRQFTVTVVQVHEPGRTTSVTSIDGMMVQDPILPSWTGKAIAAALAVCALAAGLWFAVLRQAVESSAQDAAEKAVQKPLQAVEQKAEEAKTQAGEAKQAANTAQTQANNTAKGQNQHNQAQTERDKQIAAAQAAMAGEPFSRRWPLSARPGRTDEASYEVPKGKILRITDVNFESQGNTGWLDLRRDKDSLGGVAPQYFRNIQDYRYISPLAVLKAGEKLVAHLDCTTPAPGARTCENAIMVGGNLLPAPTPAPTTSATPN